jgi:2-polyprenyl-3-methyl-5-hydroxy-6-metoxy-1,4-benzoquinol methylase
MLKVEDIRPDGLLAGQRAAMERDIALIKSWAANFVDVTCPACDSAEREPLYEKYGLQHHRCDACRTQYISPRPTPELLAKFYAVSENYAYWAQYIYPASAESRRRNIFVPRARLVADLVREKGMAGGTFVEVGAGYGIFCEELKKLDLFDRIVGLEPSPKLAEICRSKGIETIELPFERTEMDQCADVVASFEVIEHLFRPKDYVSWLHRILKPGGLAIVTCPNIEGFDTLLLAKDAIAVDHQHLNYFHPASIAALFERAGFSAIEVTTPGVLDVDLVRRAFRAGTIGHDRLGPILGRIIEADDAALDTQLQTLLQNARLSSNMMVVARKKA